MQLFKKFFCPILFFFLFSAVSVMAADKGSFSVKPGTNNGKKWRVGYFEGGEYINYQLNFLGIVRGLMDMGWMENAKIPEQSGEQTAQLWQWLTDNTKSRYIEFVKDAHYSGNWDTPRIEKMVPEIVSRLNNKKDIDLIIAAGTKAGLKLATNDHKVPTLVISTTDPLAAGIIKSVDDSGFDHVHARVDPCRHRRQIQLFHDIIGFNKLGIAYQDTEQGRSYAALESVKEVAGERGFEIVPCFTTDESADIKKDEEAELIVYDPPVDVLSAADDIFEDIEPPKQ